MFLDEHIWAPVVMSVAFVVALLGVLALGAYVVYCDAKNRAGEKDLVLAENLSGAGSHSVDGPQAGLETVAPAEPEPAAVSSAATARSISRRRKPGPPPPA